MSTTEEPWPVDPNPPKPITFIFTMDSMGKRTSSVAGLDAWPTKVMAASGCIRDDVDVDGFKMETSRYLTGKPADDVGATVRFQVNNGWAIYEITALRLHDEAWILALKDSRFEPADNQTPEYTDEAI